MAFSEPETGNLLDQTFRARRPRHVMETGALIELSALGCARALERNHRDCGVDGRIDSISLNSFYRVEQPLTIEARAAERLGLSRCIRFFEGASATLNAMPSHGAVALERDAYLRQQLDIQTHRVADFVRCGFRSWIAEAFLERDDLRWHEEVRV